MSALTVFDIKVKTFFRFKISLKTRVQSLCTWIKRQHLNHCSKQTWRHAFRPFFNTQSRLSAIVEWVTRSLLRKKSSREVLVSNLHHFVCFNTNHVDGCALCARKNLSSRMNEIKTRRRNARKKAEISFEVNESSRILFSSLLARHFLPAIHWSSNYWRIKQH